jgi:hypothetical protein
LADVALCIAVQSASSHIAQRHRRRTNHPDAAHTTVEMVDKPCDDGPNELEPRALRRTLSLFLSDRHGDPLRNRA